MRRKGACHTCTAAACTHNLELEEGGEGVTDSQGVSIARPVVRHVVDRHSNISQQQFWTVDSVLRKNERRSNEARIVREQVWCQASFILKTA